MKIIAGITTDWDKYTVYLGRTKLETCVEADDTAGYAIIVLQDPKNKLLVKEGQTEFYDPKDPNITIVNGLVHKRINGQIRFARPDVAQDATVEGLPPFGQLESF